VKPLLCQCALVLCCLTCSLAQPTVTVEGLLQEMVDMERLSVPPVPGLECDQQSSYDRASTAPDRPDWFANGDAGQFIRQEQHGERTEYVMAEMEGPGAILRLWSANPDGGGNVRIYIDDLETPALEEDFLALTSAALPQFPEPYSGRRSLGANLYFPFPYQNRCKVTVDRPNLYYHVGYRTYPQGTQVQPYSMELLPELRSTMDRVGAILLEPAEPFTISGARRYDNEVVIRPGQTSALRRLSGPSAIVRMELRVDVPPEQLFAALRECVLTISHAGEATPAVWAPLGDFFGSTPGLNVHESLPVGMLQDGLCYCNWFIPVPGPATVAIVNDSEDPVKLRLSCWLRPMHRSAEEWSPLLFRAKWRSEWLPEDPQFVDWPMLEATGPGRFVGVMQGVVNSQQVWWGEGDEKVWVDDDTFPSYFGTGSEDYYGYAWCSPLLFTHAYHNQSIVTGPGNFGYTAVARYHILDDIPYQGRMRFDIEKWAAAPREYCCTAFWYSAPGATDFFEPVPVDERRVRPLPERFRVKGALEGEKLEIARCTGGTTQIQGLWGDGFSDATHLWWLNPGEGDILETKVPVERAGRYRLVLGLTKSWDYGIHQPLVNGADVGEPVDLLAAAITPLRLDLGVHELQAGENLVGLRCVGTNPEAKPKNYMAGIDYILLEAE
jgi:hypothetical protein